MANEVSALLEVAGDTVDRLAIMPTQSLHRAVARRVFSGVGPASAPIRVLHDGIANAAYAAVRAATMAVACGGAAAVRALAGSAEVRPLSASRRGRNVVSAINAAVGDLLAERGSDLAIQMSVRKAGADVAATRHGLRSAFPKATGRVAVFLHGLAESEEWWMCGSTRRDCSPVIPFGDRLRAELGITPVYVRYNTGLHVSQNGDLLSTLLDEVVAAWPVELEQLTLIAHSMGGLVARSACHAAVGRESAWPYRVRHLVTLGTPHTGAPLEKAVHAVAWALRKVPEARPVADILDARSAGIRDLRYGYLVEEDWRAEDPDRLFDDRRSLLPLLHGCTHTFIVATITRDPSNPLGWAAGDLLVRIASAGGRHHSRSIPVPPESVVHLGPLTHVDLLDHRLVYDRIRKVLAEERPAIQEPSIRAAQRSSSRRMR